MCIAGPITLGTRPPNVYNGSWARVAPAKRTIPSNQMIQPWERKLTLTALSGALALALVIQSCPTKGAERIATLQSARPWSIGQCDRLTGTHARAVFNRSMHSHNGWPLWLVVCLYP